MKEGEVQAQGNELITEQQRNFVWSMLYNLLYLSKCATCQCIETMFMCFKNKHFNIDQELVSSTKTSVNLKCNKTQNYKQKCEFSISKDKTLFYKEWNDFPPQKPENILNIYNIQRNSRYRDCFLTWYLKQV